MNGINPAIARGLSLLSDPQAKNVYKQALEEADGGTNGDRILTQAEFNKGNEAFFKTETFMKLSAAKQESFKNTVKADTVWEQQGAMTYDGMEKQTAYYKYALANGNKNKNGDPVVVTQEQLEYAEKNGFGDTNGDNKITGLELAVADVDGDGKINFKDGDITGNGKVNASDRGIDFRSNETASDTPAGDVFDMKKFMVFFQQFMKMLLPNTAMQIPTMPTQTT
jgi:hypothetical protein